MTKSRNEIFEEVKKIVIEHLNPEPEKVTESASFAEDLKADSLDTVELIMSLEERFGLSLPDEVAEKIKTVGDVVDLIEKHDTEKSSG